jgi:signal transduction histidine kinase/DNA-binding response OmpR family regulator
MNPRRWLFLAFGLASLLQASERGKPIIDVIVTQDLLAAHQNNAVLELPDGRIAVSNIGGLLLFDGARWRFWNHPNRLGDLSNLALAANGRMYAGFAGDLGYYEPDGKGAFAWRSLLDLVAANDRHFGSVSRTVLDTRRQGVWFVTSRRLFFYDFNRGQIKTIGNTGNFAAGFVMNGEVWFHNTNDLLMTTHGDNPADLIPVAGREPFEKNGVRSAFADERGELVALTNMRTFRREPGATHFQPFATVLWPYFFQQGLKSVQPLRDNRYLLLFKRTGPMLLDQNGQRLVQFDETDGFPRNPSNSAIEDRFGAIWIAQERTVVRMDLASGITRFDATNGLQGADEIVRWQGTLFAVDGAAAYQLRAPNDQSSAHFEQIFPELSQTSCLAKLDEQRLLIGGVGLWEIRAAKPNDMSIAPRHGMRICNHMVASRFVPGRVWVAWTSGLLRIDTDGPQNVRITALAQFTQPLFSIAEEDAQTVWVADRAGGLWRSQSESSTQAPTAFGPAQKLPVGTIKVYPGLHHLWFATSEGLRFFNSASQEFVAPMEMPIELRDSRLFSLLEDETGAFWARGDVANGVFLADRNGIFHAGDALSNISHNRTILGFVREANIVWVSRSDDLLRLDLDEQKPLPPPLAPVVVAIDDIEANVGLTYSELASLNSGIRQLRFFLAMPSPHRHESNSYRTRLSGVDNDWSSWSERSEREYTQLSDGTHIFELEAKDSYGRIASAAPIRIGIAPPWFRSPLAYSCMAAVGVFMLWLASKFGARRRQRALMIRQRELETTVADRTHELSQKNTQLANQAERLQEVDRLKTRFFINVGHEFRTPLTLVMGPVDDLLNDRKERFSDRVREQLAIVQRNAKRVLDLIIELLDVNRFEHGQLQLHPVVMDARELVARIAADSAPLIARYGHQLKLTLSETPCTLRWDDIQIERALSNLLSNAAKYMARGGQIELMVNQVDAHIVIAVVDQGRGIAPDALPHVFDRFYQADGNDQASGYGIGLALVREIVEAHGGEISVTSTLGVGSQFSLQFDLAKASAAGENVLAASAEPVAEVNPEMSTLTPSRMRILVVDDHDDMRHRVASLLGERFDVLQANDGPSAWRLVSAELPDLVVADVMMPGFDGVDLTKRIRADAETSAIGILLLTAKVGSEYAVAGLQAGANDYLAKPFDASELQARCEAILQHAQRLRLRLRRSDVPMTALPVVASQDDKWRQRLDQLIAAELSEASFAVEQLAIAMHTDRSQLFRKCKELLGMSPSEYLREQRLRKGHELLARDAGSISEVAYAVGFESLSSFTRAFKARFELSPSAARATKTA